VMSAHGGRKLLIPMVTITIAALSLSGIFPLAGFFSKEGILTALAHLDNKLWLFLGLLGAFLTAYYTFRVIFVLLFPRKEARAGEHQAPAHASDQDHEEHHGVPWVMSLPLLILAGFTLSLGFCQSYLEHYLLGEVQHHEVSYFLLGSAVAAAVGGIAVAWVDWGSPKAKWVGFISRFPMLENFFVQKWYMDHFWRWFLNTFIYGFFSRICTYNDRRIVDGGVDGVALGTIGSGRLLSFIQTAFLQYNLLFMVLVLAGIGLYLLMGR
jgi:NADH-quinone oxidoreductase subunit L